MIRITGPLACWPSERITFDMALPFLRKILLVVSAMLASTSWAAPQSSPELPPAYIESVRDAIRYFSDRDFAKTIEALDKAEAILPPSPLTLNTRGAVRIEERKFEEGAQLCRRALEIDPKFYPARFNLCEIPMMQKRYAEARAMFQGLLDEFPTDELVMFRILVAFLMEKDDNGARRMLDRIPFPSKTAAYYYGNAAWEFAHNNAEEADKWVKRGNWVFQPRMTVNFSDALKEVGWITETPGATSVLPDLLLKDTSGASKLELAAPEPAAPLVPADKEAPPKPEAPAN